MYYSHTWTHTRTHGCARASRAISLGHVIRFPRNGFKVSFTTGSNGTLPALASRECVSIGWPRRGGMKGTEASRSVVERSFYRWRSSNKKGKGGWIPRGGKSGGPGWKLSSPYPLLSTTPARRERRSTYNERRQRFSIIPGRKPGPFHMRETYDSGRRRDSTPTGWIPLLLSLSLSLFFIVFFLPPPPSSSSSFFGNHRVGWLYWGSGMER